MSEPGSAFEALVMHRFNVLEQTMEDVRAEVVGVRIDVATLKVKAGMWGAAAGCLPALIAGFVVFVGGGSP